MTYTIKKSTNQTKDGFYIYNFQDIPQEHCYIKIHNLFLKNDKQAKSKAAQILQSTNFDIKFVNN